jgi:two-component system OmpR family response regulator
VADGAGLRRAMTAAAFDVVMLDLMLPDENGLDLCRWVRGKSDAAVVMLTALGDPISRVLGLELGADDYMAKPFEPRELVARIHAVLRRSRAAGRRRDQRRRPGAVCRLAFDRMKRQLLAPSRWCCRCRRPSSGCCRPSCSTPAACSAATG